MDVAEQRIRDINPDCIVRTYKTFYMPDTKDEFDFTQYDYIADAIDTVTGKLELVMNANASGTPIISSMGAGNKVNAAAFEVADIYQTSVCPLARVMRYECRKRGIKKLKVVYSKEKPIRPLEDMPISCHKHCIRPRGSLIGKIGSIVNLGLKRPKLYGKKWFRPALWAVMMGSFVVLLVLVIPHGISALGNAVLIFMESATLLAITNGILFTPRQWCTICPMGYTSSNLRGLRKKLDNRIAGKKAIHGM